MTLKEKELLARFLQQLETANADGKDAEAEAQIKAAIAKQPDAAYLLVQRTLQLEQLLEASQQQVKNMKSGAEQAVLASRGFDQDPNAWGTRPAADRTNQQSASVRNAVAGQRTAGGGSWGGGLFGNIAATAAGVVAGSFLFQGIQGLLNNDEPSAAATPPTDPSTQADAGGEPELLNSYETPAEDAGGGFLADLDDPSDFV